MITYYGSQISPNKVETSEGFLICRNVPIARIGEQDYLARELQLSGDQDRIVKVNRYDVDVFDKAALASFEGKPVTDGHPADSVGPENFGSLAKGHIQNVRREGDRMVADLYINDASLISDIQNGIKREVSCGYMCNYEPDGDGFKQTHIRGNHVAVVHSGRAGHDVAIKDAAAKTAEERTHAMSKFSKAVLTAFGVAAKDAKDEEELKALTALAHDALDSEPAEEAPEEEPAKDEDCEEEKAKDEAPDDLGSKLDKVIDMLDSLCRAKDADPEETEDEDEEETLDDAIEELESGDEDPEETEDEDEEEAKDEDPEASEVIEDEDPEETEDEDEEEKKASDTAAFLRRMRPAVAAISNKDERAAVTKALLSAVRAKDSSRAIFDATRKAAQKASDSSSKTSYERRCEVQGNAYAKHNPHVKK